MPAQGVDIAIWILVVIGVICTGLGCFAFLDASDPKSEKKMRKLTSVMVCNCDDFVYRSRDEILKHAYDPEVLAAKEMESVMSAKKQASMLGWEEIQEEEDQVDKDIVNIV